MDGSLPPRLVPLPPLTLQASIDALAAEITELSGHMNAASYKWLMLIAEFDRREGWNDGSKSCAHWLNWKIGITMGAAREKVRVARALEGLPKISAAMARGKLSYYKVREITRVACPKTEDTLLMYAQHGSAHQVETMVRLFRRAKEEAELSREAAQQVNRCVTWLWDDDGSVVIKARLPAEAGVVVIKALNLAVDEINKQKIQAGEIQKDVPYGTFPKSNLGMRRADALGMVAESFLAHGAEEMSGGDKHQVVIHVSEDMLRKNSDHSPSPSAHSPSVCEFEDGPSMAADTARRLACDASVVRILEPVARSLSPVAQDQRADPLDIGRKTRTIPPALQRALNSRDQGCRFPGCCNTRYTNAHHIEHWANGGETKLKNLVALCRFHHRLVHEGDVRIEVLDDGAFRFIKPNGEVHANAEMNGPFNALHITRFEAARPAQMTNASCDYGQGVDALLFQVGMLQIGGQENVPGGTSESAGS